MGDGAWWRNRRAVASVPAADEHAIRSGVRWELEAAAVGARKSRGVECGGSSGLERVAGVSCSCAARGEGGADEDRTHRWAACPSGPHGGLARSQEHWATAGASTRQEEKHGVFVSHFQKRHQAPKPSLIYFYQ
jgi:hypothetical protein